MVAVAQYYSDNLRSEVIKGMQEKVRQGWPSGMAAFGYLNVKNDRACPIIPDPERSRGVVWIFELYSTDDVNLESLPDLLKTEGADPPTDHAAIPPDGIIRREMPFVDVGCLGPTPGRAADTRCALPLTLDSNLSPADRLFASLWGAVETAVGRRPCLWPPKPTAYPTSPLRPGGGWRSQGRILAPEDQ